MARPRSSPSFETPRRWTTPPPPSPARFCAPFRPSGCVWLSPEAATSAKAGQSVAKMMDNKNARSTLPCGREEVCRVLCVAGAVQFTVFLCVFLVSSRVVVISFDAWPEAPVAVACRGTPYRVPQSSGRSTDRVETSAIMGQTSGSSRRLHILTPDARATAKAKAL